MGMPRLARSKSACRSSQRASSAATRAFLTPSGTTVIPVSKVTVGFLSGDGEYGQIKIFQPNKNYPSSTASGGVAAVRPCGFLIEKGKTVKYIDCPDNVFEKAIDTFDHLVAALNEN